MRFLPTKLIISLSLAAYLFVGTMASAHGVDTSEIRKLVNAFMTSAGVSGVAISLIQKGKHEELYFGNTGRPERRAVSEQTLFEIGSITKVLTPHLMMLAQKEGKLSINDPVSKYIPELKAIPVFDQISLADLARHTSSLPAYYDTPTNLKSKKDVIRWLSKWKAPFPPKSRYVYSNIGIALIGFALENIYHQDWDKLLTAKILLPRKMLSTYQHVPTDKRSQIAQGFDSDQKPASLLSESWPLYPAGILKSNARDLGAYVASWDEEFLKNLNGAVCFSNHSCQGLGIEAHPLTALSQTFVNDQFTVDGIRDPSLKKEEKLQPLSQIFVDKSGSTGGMSAYVAMIPSKRVGVVILCNKRDVAERISLGRKILNSSKG